MDVFKTDLAVRFAPDGAVDLDLGTGDIGRVSGLDNLAQALQLRLLTDEGLLSELGHPRYGSRLGRLIGERLDRASVELLRRYARKALLQDGRVAEVLEITGRPRPDAPCVIELLAKVRAVSGEELRVGAAVDLT